jgi:plastocyanin
MSAARTRRVALAGGLFLVVAAAVSPVIAADAGVSIVGTSFEPATITINQGDTVTWTVTEAIGEAHSVTSGTQEDSGKIFDSGTAGSNSSFNLRDNGQTFEHQFNEAGEFLYYCVIHPTTMTGKVVVLAEGASPPPSIEPPPSEQHTAVPPERKVAAGAILAIGLVLMFGMAFVWRRMNPA